MEVTDAYAQTTALVTALVAGLTPEHREAKTPCEKWNVHDLVNHMVGGGYMIASALSQDESLMPEADTDLLPEGPGIGWAAAIAAMDGAISPENLENPRKLPFGEMPGAVGLSVIVADHLTHAWDLARATDQDVDVSDELCEWATQTWGMILTDDLRNGDAFDVVQPCGDDAPAIDKLAAFTGRSV